MQACLMDTDLPFVDNDALAQRPTFELPASSAIDLVDAADADLVTLCPELAAPQDSISDPEPFTGINNVRAMNSNAGHILNSKIDFSVSTPEPILTRPMNLTRYIYQGVY
jgi:hypothetical protein